VVDEGFAVPDRGLERDRCLTFENEFGVVDADGAVAAFHGNRVARGQAWLISAEPGGITGNLITRRAVIAPGNSILAVELREHDLRDSHAHRRGA